MPKIDIANVKIDTYSGYPEPHRQVTIGRERKRLGNAVGLDQFGVNLTTLTPGAWSAQRHWHAKEDEFIYVVAGELVLCEDDGETVLKPGDAAGWKANAGNGHCLINRSDRDAVYLEIGTRLVTEHVVYSDIDMELTRDASGIRYLHKNGEPYT
ncbi:MAG: cupin domain-containing protein [Rhizobiales bacterium]|nr:cupin domain-containing protein [Hyphomicrobiales bacterium]